MNQITVRIQGGLGNQMFQYAAGLALARRLGVPLFADLDTFRNDCLRTYELAHWQLHAPLPVRSMPQTLRLCRGFRRLQQACGYYREAFYGFDDAAWQAIKAPVYLDGYFQSPHYFKTIEATIRQDFHSSAAPHPGPSGRYAEQIRALSCPVAVHVRRGDYASNPQITASHGLLNGSYYEMALNIMDRLTDGRAQYVVFSDDINAALQIFSARQVLAIRHPAPVLPQEDIVLMQSCHHHIIANSSFSWWGAWLNPRQDKYVIAPRMWFSREKLRLQPVHDLFPAGWIQV